MVSPANLDAIFRLYMEACSQKNSQSNSFRLIEGESATVLRLNRVAVVRRPSPSASRARATGIVGVCEIASARIRQAVTVTAHIIGVPKTLGCTSHFLPQSIGIEINHCDRALNARWKHSTKIGSCHDGTERQTGTPILSAVCTSRSRREN